MLDFPGLHPGERLAAAVDGLGGGSRGGEGVGAAELGAHHGEGAGPAARLEERRDPARGLAGGGGPDHGEAELRVDAVGARGVGKYSGITPIDGRTPSLPAAAGLASANGACGNYNLSGYSRGPTSPKAQVP